MWNLQTCHPKILQSYLGWWIPCPNFVWLFNGNSGEMGVAGCLFLAEVNILNLLCVPPHDCPWSGSVSFSSVEFIVGNLKSNTRCHIGVHVVLMHESFIDWDKICVLQCTDKSKSPPGETLEAIKVRELKAFERTNALTVINTGNELLFLNVKRKDTSII